MISNSVTFTRDALFATFANGLIWLKFFFDHLCHFAYSSLILSDHATDIQYSPALMASLRHLDSFLRLCIIVSPTGFLQQHAPSRFLIAEWQLLD